MVTDPPGAPFGPHRLICVACATFRRDEATGEILRDTDGHGLRYCDDCIGRTSDRLCECTWCKWLEMT